MDIISYLMSAALLSKRKKDVISPADCIVVLSGPISSDGQLSAMYRDRLKEAYKLYKAGYASKILLSGGHGLGASKFAFKELRAMGIPEEDLILEMKSKYTKHHPFQIKQMSKQLNMGKLIIVTSSFHIYRAQMLFKLEGFDLSNLTFVPVDHPWLRNLWLWKLREIVLLIYNNRFRLLIVWFLLTLFVVIWKVLFEHPNIVS